MSSDGAYKKSVAVELKGAPPIRRAPSEGTEGVFVVEKLKKGKNVYHKTSLSCGLEDYRFVGLINSLLNSGYMKTIQDAYKIVDRCLEERGKYSSTEYFVGIDSEHRMQINILRNLKDFLIILCKVIKSYPHFRIFWIDNFNFLYYYHISKTYSIKFNRTDLHLNTYRNEDGSFNGTALFNHMIDNGMERFDKEKLRENLTRILTGPDHEDIIAVLNWRMDEEDQFANAKNHDEDRPLEVIEALQINKKNFNYKQYIEEKQPDNEYLIELYRDLFKERRYSDRRFKNKYLKYKAKYLELKRTLTISNNSL